MSEYWTETKSGWRLGQPKKITTQVTEHPQYMHTKKQLPKSGLQLVRRWLIQSSSVVSEWVFFITRKLISKLTRPEHFVCYVYVSLMLQYQLLYVSRYMSNSVHMARIYARIFVHGYYLLLKAHSFPRATLPENCLLMSADIFTRIGGYFIIYFCAKLRLLCLLSFKYFLNTRTFENRPYSYSRYWTETSLQWEFMRA